MTSICVPSAGTQQKAECLNALSQKSAACAAPRGRAGSFPWLPMALELLLGAHASCLRGVTAQQCLGLCPSGAGAEQQSCACTHPCIICSTSQQIKPSSCVFPALAMSLGWMGVMVMDGVWLLREAWPSYETFRKSFTALDLL